MQELQQHHRGTRAQPLLYTRLLQRMSSSCRNDSARARGNFVFLLLDVIKGHICGM